MTYGDAVDSKSSAVITAPDVTGFSLTVNGSDAAKIAVTDLYASDGTAVTAPVAFSYNGTDASTVLSGFVARKNS